MRFKDSDLSSESSQLSGSLWTNTPIPISSCLLIGVNFAVLRSGECASSGRGAQFALEQRDLSACRGVSLDSASKCKVPFHDVFMSAAEADFDAFIQYITNVSADHLCWC